MTKINRTNLTPIDPMCNGKFKIDISRATFKKKYVKLLQALKFKPYISKDTAYTFAYGSHLNSRGKRFSNCVWVSLRQNGLIEEYLNAQHKHVYKLTKLGEKCIDIAFTNDFNEVA